MTFKKYIRTAIEKKMTVLMNSGLRELKSMTMVSMVLYTLKKDCN